MPQIIKLEDLIKSVREDNPESTMSREGWSAYCRNNVA
jgi:hypothetical protein